jgi:gliding motility-associated-like protein
MCFFSNSITLLPSSVQRSFSRHLFVSVVLFALGFSSKGATINSNAITGNWTSTASWSGGVVPGAGDVAVIVSGANITINSNITIGTVQINSGGILNGSSFSITLLGNWTENGTFNMGTSTIIFNGTGSQTINGSSAISFRNIIVNNTNGGPGMGVSSHPVNVNVYGDFQNNGVFNRNNTSFPAAKVTFAGNSVISGTNSLILHNIDILAGATLYGATGVGGGTFDMYFTGTWNNMGTFVPGTGKVNVQYSSANTTQQIFPGGSPFYNLTINKNVIVAPQATMIVQNDLVISTGTLSPGTVTINVGGNFTNSSNFTAGTGIVILNGTGNQTVTTVNPFYNLQLNKTSGNVFQASNVQVTNNLSLTNGRLFTYVAPSNLFEMYLSNNATGAIIGGSANSCVTGNLRRAIGAGALTYNFPLGVTNTNPLKYRPVSYIQTSSGGASNINMQLDTTFPAPVKTANWFLKLTPNAGNPVGRITMNYNLTNDFLSGTQECLLTVLRGQASNVSNWNFVLPTVTSASGGANGTITSNLPTNLNPFGYIIGEALPVAANANICDGSTATLFATSPGGSAHFNWYDSATAGNLLKADTNAFLSPILNANTTYYLEYFDSLTNCKSARVPVTVSITPLPSSAFSVPDTLCLGSTGLITFQGSVNQGATYFWNFDGGIVQSGSGSSNHQVSWNSTGTKNITLSIADSPCNSTLTVHSVIVVPTPSQPFFNTSNFAVCKGDSITLTAGGSNGGMMINYSIYDSIVAGNYLGSTPLTVQITDTTTYYLEVTNEYGCKSKATRDSLTIISYPLPLISTPYSSEIGLCYGDSTKLYANLTQPPQANIYWWNNATGGTLLSSNDTIYTGAIYSGATYWVEAITQHGCTNGGRIPVTVSVTPFSSVNLNTGLVNNIIQSGLTLTVEAQPSGYPVYDFYLNGTLIQSSASNILTLDDVSDQDKITAIATDSGCTGSVSDQLAIRVLPVANAFTPNGDGYNDIFLKGFDLTIFNRWGQMLYEGTAGWDGNYQGARVSAGTYFYVYRKKDKSGNTITVNGPVTVVID